ncbi:hypothetical protein Tco_0474820 [Tanacetum coccineum]
MVHQLTKFHVQRVDMVINPPWNLPFIGAKGLTSPEQTATVHSKRLMAKTVNEEVKLQALVDRKKIIITESTVRRDLQLKDVEGVDCLPNATIFEQLALMGAKTTAWNEFSSTMASAIICLATNQKFNFSKYIFKSMVKNLDNFFDQPPQYSIDHQEDLNQQRISDVHVIWDKIEESYNELLKMMQSFCEMVIQQKQAANIDQSPPQEMSIQEIEDLKQQYLDEMQSISNQIQIKDYHNEKIDIRYRRECEIMIDELTGKFNGMSIKINKKKELHKLE